ncbi:MAG: SGNH/GDSL hydrolase family protein [Atopobiaceae bacterium]|nr:SGNH/GDSL hydrolase family protein [Atopobiaceae bacterium]
MSLVDLFAREYDSPAIMHYPVGELLRGTVSVKRGSDGWLRPWRLTEAQRRVLLSCRAWHPGLFRQMAACTAGICLEFETDAHQIALEIRLDAEPQGTTKVLELVDASIAPSRQTHDGVSCEVDGLHLPYRMPIVSTEFDSSQEPVALVGFDIAPGEQNQIPGLGTRRRVTLRLPSLRGCELRDLLCDGTYVEPCEKRPKLLVIGDSVAQGFVADDPAWAWPSLLASALGLELVNQGIGGEVFQPGFVADVASQLSCEHVVVALGANYRFERCSASIVAAEIRAFLGELESFGSETNIWIVSPVWLDRIMWPAHPHSCIDQLEALLTDALKRHEGWHFVSGKELMDQESYLLAEDACHPGPFGHEQIAERLAARMSKSENREHPQPQHQSAESSSR